MTEILFPFAGGLGLFLIGMMLMSQGLVGFAGGALQRALIRFTGSPFRAFASGTVVTMLVQSSTATTVTLIGFVSAGLIGFSQAIGVLIGASLGNTATGWIVAGLGLKISLGYYTMPLIGVGAFLKLLGRGRITELGLALAGFGLMFTGLDTLSKGMQALSTVFNLASLPVGGYGARMAVMLVGLTMTAIMQSSTAAIATTLTALHGQVINFDQAAALVVGAAIGTTLTGVISAIGGTVHAKRTALAYVLFNAGAGIIAIALLPLFHTAIGWLNAHMGLDAGASSLAAFHTLFIAVGVLLFLPVAGPFSRWIERLVPDTGSAATARLDASLLTLPDVALEASERALEHLAGEALAIFEARLRDEDGSALAERLRALDGEIDRVYDFVGRIELPAGDEASAASRIAQLHAIDHLLRLRTRLHDLAQATAPLGGPDYAWATTPCHRIADIARRGLAARDLAASLDALELEAVALTGLSNQHRQAVLGQAASGAAGASDALRRTDSYRWIERSAHHIWRMGHYLAQGRLNRRQKGPPESLAHPPLDAEAVPETVPPPAAAPSADA
ncbi:Na/Pi cotransporter family protein [Hydrogenophaga sp. NFH-34]|uniref:Na/Pi cotransporter family protein n=2 Tax=Hydrogenophaga TaxID=47420 RepID=UPI001F26CDAC|nr:Na/Pi symporter [Hydrogenophaga sp. NFH-34]